MGYYITLEESTYRVKADKLFDAYIAMCELNKLPSSQKRGGMWAGGKQTGSWFSWMTEDYPNECKDAADIFEMLGFTYAFDPDNGDLLLTGYDSKMGQEDLFLEACAPYAEGYIKWRGEEGDTWTYEVPKTKSKGRL